MIAHVHEESLVSGSCHHSLIKNSRLID